MRAAAVCHASPALPGAVHDIIDAPANVSIRGWDDKGRWEKASVPATSPTPRSARSGDQVMATLKTWRLLGKLRCSTTRIAAFVQSVLTLHLRASN